MFRWLRRKPSKTPSEPAVPTDIEEDHIVEVVPERHNVTSPTLQSIYLSPSERNLYLASLAGLDKPTSTLPLWSEPAPKIPELDFPTPIPTPILPAVPSPQPRRPRLSGITPVSFGPRGHALLTLSGNGELRFVGFNKETILAAEKHLSTWHLGVEGRSRLPEDGGVWRIVLKGRVWRVKGNKELPTIEMLLGLFTLLGQHGWTAIGPMAAGLGKHEFQNVIFANGSNHAPVYMALSLPLPDRISIIYPPDGVSGKLIEPVRNAILKASPPIDKSSSFTAFKEAAKRNSQSTARRSSTSRTSTDTGGSGTTGPTGASSDSRYTEQSMRDPSSVIKLEGWVHSNVYRFWLAGMSRWSISKSVILKHQPPLMLEILTTLSSQHLELAASIPLSPRIPGRDLLIFATTAASDMSSLDPLLSTPRARPTLIREQNLPDEPLMISYDGPSSHPDSDGEMPPPNILSQLELGSDSGPVSRYATPDSTAAVANGAAGPNGPSSSAGPASVGSGSKIGPVELRALQHAVDMSGRPSIDTIKSWATTVNTSQVHSPGSPGSPGRPGSPILTPRSSLDPQAWGAQRWRASTPVPSNREGNASPEPPSSYDAQAAAARRRPAPGPAPIGQLVFSAVGSAPNLQHIAVSELSRNASDASSRSSRATLDSSVQSHASLRWSGERPAPISPLVYNAVGSAPNLQHVAVSELSRQMSDSSRSSRITLDSSVNSHSSFRWEREWTQREPREHGERREHGDRREPSDRREAGDRREASDRRETSEQHREKFREPREVREIREREMGERRHSRHRSEGDRRSRHGDDRRHSRHGSEGSTPERREKGKGREGRERANGTPEPRRDSYREHREHREHRGERESGSHRERDNRTPGSRRTRTSVVPSEVR